MVNPIVEAFLDGFTGGSLFTRLPQPGAATQVFADEADESSPAAVRFEPQRVVFRGRDHFHGGDLITPTVVPAAYEGGLAIVESTKLAVLLEQLDEELSRHEIAADRITIRELRRLVTHGSQE